MPLTQAPPGWLPSWFPGGSHSLVRQGPFLTPHALQLTECLLEACWPALSALSFLWLCISSKILFSVPVSGLQTSATFAQMLTSSLRVPHGVVPTDLPVWPVEGQSLSTPEGEAGLGPRSLGSSVGEKQGLCRRLGTAVFTRNVFT